MRHKKRYDFKKTLIHHGLSKDVYFESLKTHDYSSYNEPVRKIAEEACEMIKNRSLQLDPVRIKIKEDHTTRKIRQIGCESPMQQVLDYIAVRSCESIWKTRFVPQQCSSIPGRGQVYGMQMIRHYIMKDKRSIRYAKKHKIRYTSKCKYVVKLDIKKCYPSADMDVFMDLFEHDCGNQAIIWLWRQLLLTHHIDGYHGFMIGALVSQFATQYMLSYVYRYAMTIKYKRRGKDLKSVSHMILFMDDMSLFGSNRKELLKAVYLVIAFVKENLHFTIKETFAIHKLGQIDMMGYVLYRSGSVKIRDRNYIKSRRLMIKYRRKKMLTVEQSKRLVSYKGYYKYSDYSRPGVMGIFKYAQSVISKEARNDYLLLKSA